MRCIKVYDCYELSEANVSTENYECVLISTCSDVSKNSVYLVTVRNVIKDKDFYIGTCLHQARRIKVRIVLTGFTE